MNKSLLANVRGRVQGVAFRYYTIHQATSLGLRGWVRNEGDGSVTVRYEGTSSSVDSLSNWLKSGPSSARVDHLEIKEVPADPSLGAFSVEY